MVPSITILIMYLLTREQRFERSLASEHVEDIRMDKGFPKGHVHDRTSQRPGSVPYLGYDDETSTGSMAESYASMLRLSNVKRLGIWETLEEDVRCA